MALTETQILDDIRDVILAQPARLDMLYWHGKEKYDAWDQERVCGTTHCLAGWCQLRVGGRGRAETCATKYLPLTNATIGFFSTNELASAWLSGRCYAAEDPATALAAAFEAAGGRVVRDGKLVGWSVGTAILVGSCRIIGQSGGMVHAPGNATIKSMGQTGGKVGVFNNAAVESEGQTGGEVWADDNATVKSEGQTGGKVWANDNATIESTGQTGGKVWVADNATIKSTGQTGGKVRVFNNATVKSEGQTGGKVWAVDNATIESTGQTGGEVWANDNATIRSTGQTGGKVRVTTMP
jgi:hypothetical protein